jgi:hypothetical protein
MFGRAMKALTFALAFILTIVLVVTGIMLYPSILGQAATKNNDVVFAFFLGPFCALLFFAWVGEKVILKVWKRKN